MRNLILALTVMLLAAPVWATVTITTSVDGQTVTIGYTSDEGLVRAFALDIAATGGNITSIQDYAVGDDNGGYGIFPGSFDDNIEVDPETGEVVTWAVAGYTPVAPGDDPDALGDLPGPGITIELGSLYPEGGSAPSPTEGVLCSITVEESVTEVCITANATRGNVVLEDANEPAELIVGCQQMGEVECITPAHPFYDSWVYHGKPDCWCNPRNCHGDSAGDFEGNEYEGYWYVGANDLTSLVAGWLVLEATAPPGQNAPWVTGPGIASVEVGGVKGICADFKRDFEGNEYEGYWYVGANDLTPLVNSWLILEATAPEGQNPPWVTGPGIPADCLDL